MNKKCKNILHGDTQYNIKRHKYKTDCTELLFTKVTFDRMVMIFYGICHFYFICSQIIVIFKECMRKGRNSYCLFSHKLYINASKLYQKWKKLPNVCHIYNVFTFRDTFSYISKLNNVIYWKCLAYTINIMYYLFLQLFFITKDLNCIKMNVVCVAG